MYKRIDFLSILCKLFAYRTIQFYINKCVLAYCFYIHYSFTRCIQYAISNENIELSILMYSEIGKKYYFCILYDGNADYAEGADR